MAGFNPSFGRFRAREVAGVHRTHLTTSPLHQLNRLFRTIRVIIASENARSLASEDQRCAIAAWGYAAILMNNPLAGTGASPKDAALAQAAIDKGRTMNAKTQRERDYLEAVAAYYDNFASRTERERQLSRAAAYEKLAAQYPKDDEAQIFYAVYLSGTQLQSDQTYANYLKAAAILEKQFKKHPNHPGVAHYLIHSYDAPPIARQGVPAARRYAGIAPDAPHALHMPSHIFTRVGAWADSVATNRRSADVARTGREPDEALHAMDYMTYAYLQLGRDAEARKVIAESAQVSGVNAGRFVGPMRSRRCRRATRWSAAPGARRRNCSRWRASSRSPRRSPTARGRSARRAAAIRPPRKATWSSSRSASRRSRPRRTPTGAPKSR